MVYTVDTKPVGGHYPKVDWGGDPFSTPPVMEDFEDGLPNTNGPKAGVPLYGGALPKVVRWDEPADNPPPDFDSTPTMNVSERARQIIELVEPGVHQFFPVDFIDRKDRLIETRYWFYICNRRDTIHPTASNMLLNKWGEYIPPIDAVRRGQELPPTSIRNCLGKLCSIRQGSAVSICGESHGRMGRGSCPIRCGKLSKMLASLA